MIVAIMYVSIELLKFLNKKTWCPLLISSASRMSAFKNHLTDSKGLSSIHNYREQNK